MELTKSDRFIKIYNKLDKNIKIKIKKQISKIIQNPEVGKPMMYSKKGTREVYIKPFRLSYKHINPKNVIYLLNLYHKDEQ